MAFEDDLEATLRAKSGMRLADGEALLSSTPPEGQQHVNDLESEVSVFDGLHGEDLIVENLSASEKDPSVDEHEKEGFRPEEPLADDDASATSQSQAAKLNGRRMLSPASSVQSESEIECEMTQSLKEQAPSSSSLENSSMFLSESIVSTILDSALITCQETLAGSEDIQEKIETLDRMGRVCLRHNKVRLAAIHFTKQLGLAQRIEQSNDKPLLIAKILFNLGKIYENGMGDFQMATMKYAKAMKILYGAYSDCQEEILSHCEACRQVLSLDVCQQHSFWKKKISNQIKKLKQAEKELANKSQKLESLVVEDGMNISDENCPKQKFSDSDLQPRRPASIAGGNASTGALGMWKNGETDCARSASSLGVQRLQFEVTRMSDKKLSCVDLSRKTMRSSSTLDAAKRICSDRSSQSMSLVLGRERSGASVSPASTKKPKSWTSSSKSFQPQPPSLGPRNEIFEITVRNGDESLGMKHTISQPESPKAAKKASSHQTLTSENGPTSLSAPSRIVLVVWLLRSLELALDLLTSGIAVLSLTDSFECCSEPIDFKAHGARLLGITVPFFVLVYVEIVFLALSIQRYLRMSTKQREKEVQKLHESNSRFGFLGVDWKARMVNILITFNPFFGFCVAYLLIYQSNRTECFLVLGLEAGSLLLHWVSIYLERLPWTRLCFIWTFLPVLPFLVTVLLVLSYLERGGVCYFLKDSYFWYEGCRVCADGSLPDRRGNCIDASIPTLNNFCGGANGTASDDSFCFFGMDDSDKGLSGIFFGG